MAEIWRRLLRERISLMRANEYMNMGSFRFRSTKLRSRSELGFESIEALVEFWAEIAVDGQTYPILIRIVSGTILWQKLVLGTDFLNTVEIHIKRDMINISPIREIIDENNLKYFRAR